MDAFKIAKVFIKLKGQDLQLDYTVGNVSSCSNFYFKTRRKKCRYDCPYYSYCWRVNNEKTK